VVDVIDERGFVDGVKVARKCSKANVLGKAVEYIRVLKRRERRLRAELAGVKVLVEGLVGGPALIREWEKQWRARFGGEEKDEVEEDDEDAEGEGEDEESEDDDGDDGDEEGAGRKRKRAKVAPSSGIPKKMDSKKEKKTAPPPLPPVVVLGGEQNGNPVPGEEEAREAEEDFASSCYARACCECNCLCVWTSTCAFACSCDCSARWIGTSKT
jgi:hypothetical protein